MSKELIKSDIQGLKSGGLSQLGENLNSLKKSLSKIELPRLFYQLVIFVIDGSKSMEELTKNKISKAKEVDQSIKSVIKRLKSSKVHNSFDISFIPFSENFDESYGIKNVKDLNEDDTFNPFDYIKEPKGTYLENALIYINGLSEKYLKLNEGKNRQVLIQILSDGEIDDYSESIKIIEKIKQNERITISCQFIEPEIDEGAEYFSWNESTNTLDYDEKWSIEDVKAGWKRTSEKFKKFSSSDQLFITSANPEEIRKHMIKSISTVSKIS